MMRKTRNSQEMVANIYSAVKSVFVLNPTARLSARRVMANMRINVSKEHIALISQVLDKLTDEGFLEFVANNKFQLAERTESGIEARVVTISPRMIFVKAETVEEDIVVLTENAPNVIVDDIVEIMILPKKRRGRVQAVISQVIERKHTKFVGVVEQGDNPNFAFVVVGSKIMPNDIFVTKTNLLGAQNNEKVLVELTDWFEGSRNPNGRVISVLGEAGNNNTEMHAILAEYDLPYEFTPQIERAADAIPTKITSHEISKRKDFRDIVTFTIDPKDAKDFDDALSIRKIDKDMWEIGVHIADVTHYVKEGTILEKEAVERATSVYLVDRVVPMLPEKLSNGLCSLRPNEEKLCFSAVFNVTTEAEIVSEWFGRTVINSDRRFTYEEAQDVIETGKGDFSDEILELDRLAKILREKRYKNGSIAFERDEVKFNLDELGKPTGVYFKEMKDANHLIEEFMLLANRKVAEFIGRRKPGQRKSRTFVYRIHDMPNEQKYEDFSKFAAKFGYVLKAKSERAIAKEMNKLLNNIKGKREENLFSVLALRSMAKAKYSTDNIGHYGLAFDYYSHFTSPIRRYPDMMVHRLLQYYLDGGASASVDHYEELCVHSSEREVRASEAERASNKYKMVEFMCDKIGQEFDGYISGITEWGVYVELNETKIEGMVSVRDIYDDSYNFDAENYRMIGSQSSRIITLGDSVKIKVVRADLKRKLLDFELISHISLTETTPYTFKTVKLEAKPRFDKPRDERPRRKNKRR
ncbi:MAG: ribonuclease R [Rikenellaceae bacterium]